MDINCQIFLGVVFFLVLVWLFMETHYFLQILFTMFVSRIIKKKASVFEETSYYGICSTTDVDVFFDHMNNSRYLREIDFARTDFYIRTRLFAKILQAGGNVVVGANLVIYKRPIRPLTGYNITSKIIYWEEKSIYMEHCFITTSDGIIRATILSQQRLINCDADVLLEKMQDPENPIEKPPIPPEVIRMVQSIKETWSQSNGVVNRAVKDDVNANERVPTETDASKGIPDGGSLTIAEVETTS